jgi:3D (Asp-Asp-Asp) domain-containing protein
MALSLIGGGTIESAQSKPQSPSRRSQPRPATAGAFEATAYCIEGTTASGAETERGIVAADPDVLPFGTVIRIRGLKSHNGVYTVKDSGRTIKGREIDLFMPSCAAAKKFGRQPVTVSIVRRATAQARPPS